MFPSKKKINLTEEQNEYLIKCFNLYSNSQKYLMRVFYKQFPGIQVSYSTLKRRYDELKKKKQLEKNSSSILFYINILIRTFFKFPLTIKIFRDFA